ncbi:MAG: trypsin-like peptidase domain-containing protein [Candidatus Eremiobacteraeota bacterium]|nr:trypsin-like peptidase domain-containing protein [Candidatus Eremiobacteraeota bacterium]
MNRTFVAGFAGALVGALLVIAYLHLFARMPGAPAAPSPLPSPSLVTHLESGSSVTAAVDKILPSVVYIDTKAFAEVVSPSNDPLGNLFGFPMNRSQVVPREGRGSGVIVSEEGLILTNEHVVHGATEILVTLSNEQHFPAKVKGADILSDIAMLVVDAKALKAAVLGNSDDLRIGESVVAVGSPYRFQQTVTVGVLSGRGRSISEQSKDFQDLLQTDAAINPGNSGGPLVNTRGEVIGINTAIIPYAQGIGFAIPINTVKNIMEQLIAHGKVSRPYIGIMMQDLNEQIARYYRLPLKEGIIIVGVAPGSPAAASGLQIRDIITEMNGTALKDAEALRKLVKGLKVGDSVSLKVWRMGRSGMVNLKMAETP